MPCLLQQPVFPYGRSDHVFDQAPWRDKIVGKIRRDKKSNSTKEKIKQKKEENQEE
jgi:hypothetical protein